MTRPRSHGLTMAGLGPLHWAPDSVSALSIIRVLRLFHSTGHCGLGQLCPNRGTGRHLVGGGEGGKPRSQLHADLVSNLLPCCVTLAGIERLWASGSPI